MDEVKVVISLKGNKGSIGIQSPKCDPVFTTFDGDLGLALERVPGLVGEARQKWNTNPQYPKCETPLPSQQAPRPTPTTRPAPRQTASTAQPQMF